MYRDNSLVPTEAIRLAALGSLAAEDRSYAELAGEVRRFVAHMVGPSLDLIGPPLEILKLEGLVAAREGAGSSDQDRLSITPAGLAEARRLLSAKVRNPMSDVGKLTIALKVRFLHLMEADERAIQADALREMCETERARLTGLRQSVDPADNLFARWLDLEIAQTEARLAWFEDALGA